MNQIRNIRNLSERELELGILDPHDSWHHEYKDNAYVYFGNMDDRLTEADILTIFSQYGNPVDIRLIYDKHTGLSKGFGYLKYEDQRSTILAVDNFNGVNILGKSMKVDHTFYRPSDKDEDAVYQEQVKKEMDKDFDLPTHKESKKASIKETQSALSNEIQNEDEDNDATDPMANLLDKDMLLPYNANEDNDNIEETIDNDEDDFADPMSAFLSK